MITKQGADIQRVESAILYVLLRAKERGVSNLSKFQIMKLLYLIDVEYRKFLGKSFYEQATFKRWDRGPILLEAYPAIDELKKEGKILVTIKKNDTYGHDRECHMVNVTSSQIELGKDEKIFLNSIIDSYVELSQTSLKKIAYATAPMRKVVAKEKRGKILKGEPLAMELISKATIA